MIRARRAISAPCAVSATPDFRLLKLSLELLDLRAERWLIDRTHVRRIAEMQLLGERLEVTELPERNHLAIRPSYRDNQEIRLEVITAGHHNEARSRPVKIA
jgi:hypothetical protein